MSLETHGKSYVCNGTTAYVSPILLRPTDLYNGRRRVYRLTQDFAFKVTFEGGEFSVSVPSGYCSDLATLPVIAQVLLGNRDDYLEEALVHDWLCDNDGARFFTNSAMRSLMEIMGRPWWKRLLIFYALQVFGYKSPLLRFFRRFKSLLRIRRKRG